MKKLTRQELACLRQIVKDDKPGFVVVNGKVIHLHPDEIREPRTGGLLPLMALIPLIAGAIGAAGGVAGGVAKSVQAANTRSHQKAMEKIARDKGVRIGRGTNPAHTPEVDLAIAVLKNAGFKLNIV